MKISLHSMNEEADFRKATQSYENMVGVNCRYTTDIELRGEPKVKHLK